MRGRQGLGRLSPTRWGSGPRRGGSASFIMVSTAHCFPLAPTIIFRGSAPGVWGRSRLLRVRGQPLSETDRSGGHARSRGVCQVGPGAKRRPMIVVTESHSGSLRGTRSNPWKSTGAGRAKRLEESRNRLPTRPKLDSPTQPLRL